MTNREANEVPFEIDNDKVIRYTPVPQYGKDIVKREAGTPREDYEPLYNCENWIP